MERNQAFTIENFISNWNEDFPNYQLTTEDLKNPHAVIGALFQIFSRLEIDREAVLSPPQEEDLNGHIIYYWDLLPVINVMRVVNHLMSIMPQITNRVSLTHFLQPTAATSHSLLLLPFHLMHFYEQRLQEIEPYEKKLYSKMELVNQLEERKNKQLEALNKQAEEKGKRAVKLEKLAIETKQFDEELKQENELLEKELLELEAFEKELQQLDIVLEQKKTQRDALVAEVARKKALRVYDAEDIQAQVEQAKIFVQEADEKLESLRTTLMQKEASLKNLQALKPNLDTANNLLHEIMKLTESLKDSEIGDLDSDSKEGELDVLNTELLELAAQQAEIQTERGAAAERARAARGKRQHDRLIMQSALRDAEEKDKKCRDRYKKALEQMEQIKLMTLKYEEEKASGYEEIKKISDGFNNELKASEDKIMKIAMDARKRLEEKLRNRHI